MEAENICSSLFLFVRIPCNVFKLCKIDQVRQPIKMKNVLLLKPRIFSFFFEGVNI